MKNKLTIAKIGGNIINDTSALDSFLKDFSKINHAKILIHGGGKIATELNLKLGFETIMHDGRRVTSSDNLDVVVMTYAGIINKTIVSKLQANSCNALGLSGADANCIQSKKRSTTPIDFGLVGDVISVDHSIINQFLENGLTPVFCALSHDGMGQMLNINADTITAEIAIAMSNFYETELIYCFEMNGVLLDVNDETSVISSINKNKYEELKENNIILEGMLPKMENCYHALNNGVSHVVIGSPNAINKDNVLQSTLTL